MDALESHIGNAARGELPGLIGKLEELRALAWSRLSLPTVPPPATQGESTSTDTLVDLAEAANRLGVSPSWLYRKAPALTFALKPNGVHWRFRTRGIEKYLRDRQRGD